MKCWIVKKGNKSVRDMLIKDKDGNTVTNLADAEEIKFQIKEARTDAVPKIEKTAGSGIEVNTPSSGYLRITLTPIDTGTTLSVSNYYMALQIKWSATDIYEVRITIDDIVAEYFEVVQDVIQS